MIMFKPKLIDTLKNYSKDQFFKDLIAGVIVGIVALPLAIAFAIASGVPPEKGILTAIIAGVIISALGGSRVQIGAPTGAFLVIVYGIGTKFGYEGLVICTILAGFILILLGLARMGALIKFIPYPVVTGFTAGIAVIIFSSQVKDFLGLKMGAVPADFMDKWVAYGEHAATMNPATTCVALGTLLVLILWPRVSRMLPAPFVAMILATVVVQLFHIPGETIGSRFGSVPTRLPAPHWPTIPWTHMQQLIAPAFTVALLAAIESLLSAVVADGMIGTRHKSNMELVAQGVANIASPLFGGIPATGAIARTATNIRSGALTPVAGMVHALTLLAILLVAAPLARFVPLATLAAVLFVVAYNMGEWREIGTIVRLSKTDIAVWITTFTLTVLADLTVAVGVGMALAALLYIRRVSETTTVAAVTPEYLEEGQAHILQDKDIPSNVTILRIHGPFLFGTTEKLAEATKDLNQFGDVVILRLRNMTALDATGMHALEQFSDRLHKAGKTLLLCGARDQPSQLISGSDFLKHVGVENVLPHVQAALTRAREIQGDFSGIGRELALELARRPL